jgi:holo-[acyl-carrier protein] synthase
MILGIGVDIITAQRIRVICRGTDDPFIKKTYSGREQEEAARWSEPVLYFASRFAGKEAVFKSLGIDGSNIRLSEIEILGSEPGRLNITLSGNTGKEAEKKGIKEVLVSLSYNDEYAVAFAIAQ